MKKLCFVIYLSLLFSIHPLRPTENELSEWTIVIYMEASENIQGAALFNLNDIAAHCSNTTNIIVFLHAFRGNGWLYKVTHNNIELLAIMPVSPNAGATVFNVMEYATGRYPAKNYALILWNHGFGILDPIYDQVQDEWSVQQDEQLLSSCPKKRSRWHQEQHKGMLFDGYHKTCLCNTEFTDTIKRISDELLNGQKVALLGLDMCKGAMVEFAVPLRNRVKYIIGSQECELIDGWPYDSIIKKLTQKPKITPSELAVHIIDAYDLYYQENGPAKTYTQSALNMSHAEPLKNNIDTVADLLCFGIQHYGHTFKQMIFDTRKACTIFCDTPMYVDIHEFYTRLYENFNDMREIIEIDSQLDTLPDKLLDGCNIISSMVVANCFGSATAFTHGISIYFPLQRIHSSYPPCTFAQQSTWLHFLNTIVIEQ